MHNGNLSVERNKEQQVNIDKKKLKKLNFKEFQQKKKNDFWYRRVF